MRSTNTPSNQNAKNGFIEGVIVLLTIISAQEKI